jgi:dissimilatory sulfite reductase related protein
MSEILVGLDAEGYLIEPLDWTEELAQAFATEEGITLDQEHWAVIRFIRESYAEKQVTPDVRHAIKHLSKTCGAGRNRIFELFPYGYVQQACKIAGMKKPRAWSTG